MTDGSATAAREMIMRDGRILRLSDSHLVLFRPNGTIESSYPRSQIIDCNSSPTTWEVFPRFWNNEEIALLASSGQDTEHIIRWAAGAPRLQRRAAIQRAIRKRRARSRIISGGSSFSIGLALLLITYQIGKTTGYFLVPIGAIGFGSVRFAHGLLEYVTDQ